MRFFTVSTIAALAAFVSAVAPNYSQSPSGNPISLPGLGEQVPVGKPYTITWQPTTPGTVSLTLVRGPSNNVTPLLNIAQSIPNTGSFVWTPPTTLQNDVTHYGLLLVVDATGQYQYSVQFGISNPNGGYGGSPSSSSSGSSSTGSSPPTSVPSLSTYAATSATSLVTPSGTPTPTSKPTGPVVSPVQTPSQSSSTLQVAASSPPSTASTTTPPSTPSKSTSGANHQVVGFSGIIAAAGLAVFLIL
jgi:hypothetical protein